VAPAGTGSQASLLEALLESFAIAAWLGDWEALETESAALRKRFAAPVHRGAASAARLHLASISKATGEAWAALQAALRCAHATALASRPATQAQLKSLIASVRDAGPSGCMPLLLAALRRGEGGGREAPRSAEEALRRVEEMAKSKPRPKSSAAGAAKGGAAGGSMPSAADDPMEV
jgi:hypothetical protein